MSLCCVHWRSASILFDMYTNHCNMIISYHKPPPYQSIILHLWKVKTTEVAISNTVFLLLIHPGMLVCSWFDRICIEQATCCALLIIICWSLLDMLFQSITLYWVSTQHAPVLIYQFCNWGFSMFPKFLKHGLFKKRFVPGSVIGSVNNFIMVYTM